MKRLQCCEKTVSLFTKSKIHSATQICNTLKKLLSYIRLNVVCLKEYISARFPKNNRIYRQYLFSTYFLLLFWFFIYNSKAPINVSRETVMGALFHIILLTYLNYIISDCKYCRLCSICNIKFFKYTGNMIFNSSLTNFHFFCYISIELTYCHLFQDF